MEAVEVEDDVFFADLNREISLLIMDDEDDENRSLPHCPSSVKLQAFNREVHYPATQTNYIHEQASRRDQSRGTGVFIPLSSHSRRKNRQRFSSSSSSSAKKFQRQQIDNSQKGIEQASYNSNNPPFNSFNSRRS